MVVFRILPEAIEETAKLVVVAELVVAFRPVKFWRVDEALERKPPVSDARFATARVPVKLALDEMVCELIKPEVMVFVPRFKAPLEVIAPRVEAPAVKLVVKRLVVEASDEKKLVEVALVVVPKVVVRARIVEEAFTNIPRVVVGAR